MLRQSVPSNVFRLRGVTTSRSETVRVTSSSRRTEGASKFYQEFFRVNNMDRIKCVKMAARALTSRKLFLTGLDWTGLGFR